MHLLFNWNEEKPLSLRYRPFLKVTEFTATVPLRYRLLILREVGSQPPDQGLGLRPCTGSANRSHRAPGKAWKSCTLSLSAASVSFVFFCVLLKKPYPMLEAKVTFPLGL